LRAFLFESSAPAVERLKLFESFREYGARQCWSSEIINEVDLILEEWITNVITYALKDTNRPLLRLRMEAMNDILKITVEDNGVPFDPLARPDPDLSVPLEERPIGGLGIFLVKKLSKEIHYKREGDRNTLTILKSVSEPVLTRK
jgi:anti-sigma regulatory factor (Ser/Thr protein kinase)